ncbi:MAG: DUF3299 domain-containing protein [Nitrosomonas sp.]|nr:DUF3299 domain-containing protein [Nitrosomonas sp.]
MNSSLLNRNMAILLLAVMLLLVACGKESSDKPNTSALTPGTAQQALDPSFKTIEWIDLMPQDDLDALLNPPDYLDEIEDGSEEDQLSNQFQTAIAQASDDRYQQALVSTHIKPEFDNQKIRLPGFIVPLEFGKNQTITRFFLVPYFGACIHLPPPPPNQIVYGVFDKGLKVDVLHEPFWINGVLHTTLMENDIAKAAYTMTVTEIVPYVDEDIAN